VRKLDGHPQPSLRACLEFDGSVVGSGDGCDDGQTQPDPAIGAGALGAAPPERPSQLAGLAGRRTGPLFSTINRADGPPAVVVTCTHPPGWL